MNSIKTTARPAENEAEQKAGHPGVQRFIDNLVSRVLLWAFPKWIRPNHLTVARFIFIPVMLVLLFTEHRWWALAVFVLAASTDFIDGSMARTRGQITVFGTYADPVADKLLIAAALAWAGYEYLVVQVILVIIVLELVLSAIGVSILVRTRVARSSNAFGKTKMIVQTIALMMFLVSGILDLDRWKIVSIYLLWVALALAVVSGSMQIRDLLTRNRRETPARY